MVSRAASAHPSDGPAKAEGCSARQPAVGSAVLFGLFADRRDFVQSILRHNNRRCRRPAESPVRCPHVSAQRKHARYESAYAGVRAVKLSRRHRRRWCRDDSGGAAVPTGSRYGSQIAHELSNDGAAFLRVADTEASTTLKALLEIYFDSVDDRHVI